MKSKPLLGADVRVAVADPAPRVSVVIPTLDGERGGNVRQLVDALKRQTVGALEVLLVVGVRPNGRARNVGARRAHGRFLVFIDDDVIPGRDDLLERMIGVLEHDDRVGLVGCSQRLPRDANRFQQRCARQLDRMTSPIVDTIEETDMATHMCIAIRRSLYEEIGGEHEHLPRGTDPELRARLRARGLRVVLAPHAWATHPPPASWSALWRTYWRNGFGSRYVADQFPEGTLPTTSGHGGELARMSTFGRGAGLAGRWWHALRSGHTLALTAHTAYALGYLNAWLWEPQWRRIKAKQAVMTAVAAASYPRPRTRSASPTVRILLYHRVAPKRHRNLVVHTDAFAWQMKHLSERHHVISLAEALHYLDTGEGLDRDAVVLTFDDITRDWSRHALPVLARLKLPATVFIAAGTVDSEVEFPWLAHEEPPDYHPVTGEQLRELRGAGIAIGAHTMTHPRLSGCDPQTQWEEITESKQLLERYLSEPVLDFAYPYGRETDVDTSCVEHVRAAGFRCGLMVRRGVAQRGDDAYRLIRTAIDPGDTPFLFRWKTYGS